MKKRTKSLKGSWEHVLEKMLAQAEGQEWWSIAAMLYCTLSEVRKLTEENRKRGPRARQTSVRNHD